MLMLQIVSRTPDQSSSPRSIALAVWLAVLLVLSGQVRANSSPERNARSTVEAAAVFCHAGQDAGDGKPVLPHHLHEIAVLQAGLAAVQHLATVPAAHAVPAPTIVRTVQSGVPQARAPPGQRVASAYARGPPVPV